ncbi:hypothetical protein DRI50_00550 [candidate division KSB1 bacterium]|nr:MAG: hypothetical protein DRI50_00550 [candidate division KSB1 bacterium]
MKSKILKIILPFVLSIAPITSHTQTINIGIGCGLTNVVGSSFYNSKLYISFDSDFHQRLTLIKLTGLDFDIGYNVVLQSLFQFNNSPFAVYGEINYNSFLGKGTMVVFTPRMNPIPPNPIDVQSSFNIVNSNIGLKYELLDKSIIPFLSSGIVVSYLSKVKITSITNDSFKFTMLKERIRFGISLGAGLNYKISSKILIGVSSKYIINNIFSKGDLKEEINILTTDLFIHYSL